MQINIIRLKKMINSLPDDGTIVIKITKEYPDKIRCSNEEINDFRKMGKILILECETIV